MLVVLESEDGIEHPKLLELLSVQIIIQQISVSWMTELYISQVIVDFTNF